MFSQELDPVTLHNQALVNMDTKPSEGFEKMAFLLQQPSFPPVTFGNLLLLYCKHEVTRRSGFGFGFGRHLRLHQRPALIKKKTNK